MNDQRPTSTKTWALAKLREIEKLLAAARTEIDFAEDETGLTADGASLNLHITTIESSLREIGRIGKDAQ